MNCKLLCVLIAGVSSCIHVAAQTPYRVVDHWKIGGTGGWDYLVVDPPQHRLYITHNARVEVLDTLSGKVLGAVTGLKSTHGVALDDEGRYGYISDGAANSVVVFDRKSLATVASIPAGTNPDGILFERTTKTVWAFNGRSNSVTVVSAADRTVIATIQLPEKPEFPQADGNGHVFVNIEDKNSVVALDAGKKAIGATWKLSTCDAPSGMAIDRAHHRIFSVCDGEKMAIVDTTTGKQLASAKIGDGPDAAGFDPNHQIAFASSGDGVLAVIDAAHQYTTIEMLPTMRGARTMAYDEKNDTVYVVTADFGARPAATAENPRPRPMIVPDSFQVLVIRR